MDVQIFDSEPDLSRFAFDLVSSRMRQGARVLGFATGSSPLGLYARLVEACRAGRISFRECTSFNLDEYVGLGPDDPHSYHFFMERHLFSAVDFPRRRTFLPDGTAADPAREARRYERRIQETGGIDLQILGVGSNGHVGFNEPGSRRDSRTRVVTLSEQTRRANRRFFAPGVPVPRQAITMGIGTILECQELLLLALGEKKGEAIRALVSGPEAPARPVSLIRRHARLTVCLDRAAARLLEE